MKPVKYWYKVTIHMCPVCGREDTYKERMPLPKAANPYIIREFYDYCLERDL